MKRKKKEEKKVRRFKFNADSFYRLIIFIVSLILIVGIITYDKKREDLNIHAKVGKPAIKDIYAPFSFTFEDESKTEQKKHFAVSKVLSVYKVDQTVNQRILDDLDIFLSEIDKEDQAGQTAEVQEDGSPVISDTNIKNLLSSEKELAEFKNLIRGTVVSILEKGLINFSRKVDLLEEGTIILIYASGDSKNINVYDLVSLGEARDRIFKIASEKYNRNRKVRSVFSDIINTFMKENIVLEEAETQKRKMAAYEAVPAVEVSVMKNEIIVSKGKRITNEQLIKLEKISKRREKKKVATGILSVGIFTLLYIIILMTYLSHFEQKFYKSIKYIILINTVIICNVLLNKVFIGSLDVFQSVFSLPPNMLYLMPTSFAALLVAILLSPRLGIFIGIGMALLSGMMVQYNPFVILITLCASSIGVFAVTDLRDRKQIGAVGLLIGVVYAVLIFSVFIIQEMPIFAAVQNAAFGLINGVIIIILLFLGIMIFENLFNITTLISLMEMSSVDHPLLKRLSLEAPGTYHHSLVVAILAESAAEAINANPLLARVGAYFHDIGKIEKAEYFTENQMSKERNFHDRLTPRMSYFIITNHVKDGIDLAHKYKLKDIIIDFIEQHHGTSVVYYFYRKALDGKGEGEDLNVDDYRYPGPKPQSKEIAITLLADTVEAASRSLANPTPASIRGLVDKVVNDKFLDNQLDECELTLLDLHKIKDTFVRNLMAIFHTRVEYPEMINENIEGKKRNG